MFGFEAFPVYAQDGSDSLKPSIDLLLVFVSVVLAQHVFSTYVDLRQHAMYSPNVTVPESLQEALAKLDAEALRKLDDTSNADADTDSDADKEEEKLDSDGEEGKEEDNIKPGQLLQSTLSKFAKTQAYGRDKSSFGIVYGVFNIILELALYLSGGYPAIWDASTHLLATYMPSYADSEIVTSCLWVTLITLGTRVISLPFSLYRTFVIEQRHGFNKQTLGLFFLDLVKQLAVTAAVGYPVLAAIISIIHWGGPSFYWYLYLFLLLVQLFMLVMYPLVIQPLFNTFEPLKEGVLRTRIHALAQRVEFPLTKLFVIDGSTRSTHSNAYFYGFTCCRNMRIVLYDTLLNQATDDEILAVLAHELGHFKLSHVFKNLMIAQIQIFSQFYLFSLFIDSPALFASFGFVETPTLVGLMLFFEVAFRPLDPVLSYLFNSLSRRFEFQADRFAVDLGHGTDLQTGLVKIGLGNLGTLAVDPLYSALHYSHPPLVERLEAITNADRKTK